MTCCITGHVFRLPPVLAAAHRCARADYRNAVLTAYQEVEDNLTALHRLEQESISESAAVPANAKALQQAGYHYKAGLVTYLEVATTETIALQAQLSRVSILNRRMDASVLLVKALGGGWRPAPLGRIDASAEAYATRTN